MLVVLGHIIGYKKGGGLNVGDNSGLRYVYEWIDYFQLPLFTLISGWVYAIKPIVSQKDIIKFVGDKMRRLLVPMFIVSTILFLFRVFIPGTNHPALLQDLPLNLIFPYDLYWFLYSLFLVFILIGVLDTTDWFHKFHYWLLSIAVAFLASLVSYLYFDSLPNFFGYKGALYLLPYFLLGLGFLRYKTRVFSGKNLLWAVLLFVVSIGAGQVIWVLYHHAAPRQGIIAFSIGVSSMFLLFKFPFSNKLLVKIGGAAYAIYLFHIFFTGGTRMMLYTIGIRNTAVIIIVSLGFAIFVPILIESFLRKFKYLRTLFLGLK